MALQQKYTLSGNIIPDECYYWSRQAIMAVYGPPPWIYQSRVAFCEAKKVFHQRLLDFDQENLNNRQQRLKEIRDSYDNMSKASNPRTGGGTAGDGTEELNQPAGSNGIDSSSKRRSSFSAGSASKPFTQQNQPFEAGSFKGFPSPKSERASQFGEPPNFSKNSRKDARSQSGRFPTGMSKSGRTRSYIAPIPTVPFSQEQPFTLTRDDDPPPIAGTRSRSQAQSGMPRGGGGFPTGMSKSDRTRSHIAPIPTVPFSQEQPFTLTRNDDLLPATCTRSHSQAQSGMPSGGIGFSKPRSESHSRIPSRGGEFSHSRSSSHSRAPSGGIGFSKPGSEYHSRMPSGGMGFSKPGSESHSRMPSGEIGFSKPRSESHSRMSGMHSKTSVPGGQSISRHSGSGSLAGLLAPLSLGRTNSSGQDGISESHHSRSGSMRSFRPRN